MDAETAELLRHTSPNRKRKLKEALRTIAGNPRLGKSLQENLVGYFSYRVGTLRIIYTINVLRKIVHVVAVVLGTQFMTRWNVNLQSSVSLQPSVI